MIFTLSVRGNELMTIACTARLSHFATTVFITKKLALKLLIAAYFLCTFILNVKCNLLNPSPICTGKERRLLSLFDIILFINK